MSGAMSCHWRRRWTSEELKALGSKVCEFKKEVVEFFSSASSSGVYTMNFHFLDHLVQNIKTLGDINILYGSVYEQFNDHIKKAYQGPFRRRSTRRQKPVMLMERQQRNELPRISTEVRITLQIVDQITASRFYGRRRWARAGDLGSVLE